MKILAKILSGFLFLIAILLIVAMFFDINDTDFILFVAKLTAVFKDNIIPIVSICLCFYCMERNDSNYLVRLIPIYMLLSIIISVILYFFCFNDYSLYIYRGSSLNGLELDSFVTLLIQTQEFLVSTHICITLISLLCVIKPNNEITSIIKKATYIIIAINIALSMWLTIKSFMEETLPNVYEYEGYDGKGFNFSTMSDSQEFANKVYNASMVAELFAVFLLFTTNYGFSVLVEYEADEIDMYEVKKEADQLAAEKMKAKYSDQPKPQETPAAPARNDGPKGLMNINNQLGVDSNVGAVKESAKEINVETGTMDELIPLSNGPVINETVNRKPLPNMANPVNEFGATQAATAAQPQQTAPVEQQAPQQTAEPTQQTNQI